MDLNAKNQFVLDESITPPKKQSLFRRGKNLGIGNFYFCRQLNNKMENYIWDYL